jgi:hypothetical protein
MNRRWLALGSLCLSSATLAVAACSNDDNGATNNTPEAGLDATGPEDANATGDASALDSSAPAPDSSAPETSTAPDEGTDGPAATCTPFDASGLDEASVNAGFLQVWKVYKCAGCHQLASDTIDDAGHGILLSGNNNGLGDSGMIFPPNLTSDLATGLGCWTNQQIEDAFLEGKKPDGGSLCKPMPKFGEPATTTDGGLKPGYPMDAGTAKEVVDYLRSLPIVMNQVHGTTCPVTATGLDAAADGPVDAPGQ